MSTTSVEDHRPFGPQRVVAAPGSSDVERLLAYEEIRQLASRYALAMDSRDLEILAGLFVEDCVCWDGSIGRDSLYKQLRWAFQGGMGGLVSFAHVGNHVINLIDADHAAGTVYCVAELGDRDRWIRQLIVYEDTYERRGGVWHFTLRDHHLVYGAELESRPLAQDAAEWPKSLVGVGTIPYVWPSWQRFTAPAEDSGGGFSEAPSTPQELLELLTLELGSDPTRTEGLTATFAFDVSGDTGGQWWIEANDGTGSVHDGVPDDPTVTIRLTEDVFVRLGTGELDGAEAYFNGLLVVEGDEGKAMFLAQIFGV